jgi:hypothetical protein
MTVFIRAEFAIMGEVPTFFLECKASRAKNHSLYMYRVGVIVKPQRKNVNKN